MVTETRDLSLSRLPDKEMPLIASELQSPVRKSASKEPTCFFFYHQLRIHPART